MLRFNLVMPLSLFLFAAMPIMLRADDAWKKLFEKASYKDAAGKTLPYRILKPEKIESGKTYPLVLFFHGAGERGNNNDSQLRHGISTFATPANREKYPCFVVAPQCPANVRWVEVDWGLLSHKMPAEPSMAMTLALKLVDQLAAKLPVDKSRIYVTGISMGGYGTWDAIQRRPDLFAAAMPICGGGDTAEAPKLKNIPIWAFHGDKDTVVKPQRTQNMIKAITDAGGKPKMTLYPNVQHDSWTATYANPEVIAWFFSQKK